MRRCFLHIHSLMHYRPTSRCSLTAFSSSVRHSLQLCCSADLFFTCNINILPQNADSSTRMALFSSFSCFLSFFSVLVTVCPLNLCAMLLRRPLWREAPERFQYKLAVLIFKRLQRHHTSLTSFTGLRTSRLEVVFAQRHHHH